MVRLAGGCYFLFLPSCADIGYVTMRAHTDTGDCIKEKE
ncbi:hypothetical protein DAQ1742_02916 [Dickeya aquatica]|uniref:Uncharacterized protein n=1 Tax=Dickeya aquatica TaxID=1401087 RepID=A0A375ACM5_9GAMM|nr:hypothetical protein DAQ1742_02916 [Dickeya aquatica]